jgi:hypothetical protein
MEDKNEKEAKLKEKEIKELGKKEILKIPKKNPSLIKTKH